MPLSQQKKDEIAEEETLRFEARMKAHERLGMKGGSCGVCGQRSGCRGCRIWAWVFAAVVVLCLFRAVAWHEWHERAYDADGRQMTKQGDAPAPALK
jgi:hypothetical protein